MNNKMNKGAALITVLIIVFIVMSIITNLTVKNYRIIRRLTNQKILEQCFSVLNLAVNFGRAGLATSASTSDIDTLNDIWAQPIPRTLIVNDIEMSGYLIDEQGKFNINDMVSNGQINMNVVAQFEQLLTYLNIPNVLALNIANYMASPKYVQGIATEYTSGSPAYTPSGRPLVDLSELQLVKGMQPDWVFKLSDYVTVVPQSIDGLINDQNESANVNTNPNINPPKGFGTVPVNINTAPAQVIAAKSGLPLTMAQRIATIRKNTPFKTQQDITNFLTSNGIIISQGGNGSNDIHLETLTTKSSYFMVHAMVDKGEYEFKWVAFLYRPNRSGQWPQILWQHPE